MKIRIERDTAQVRKSGFRFAASLLCVLLAAATVGCKKKSTTESAGEEKVSKSGGEVKKDKLTRQEEGHELVFDLEEFSIFECEEPFKSRLTRGAHVWDSGDKPSKKVRAYPLLKSEHPVYGTATFDISIIEFGRGLNYCFVIDESGGTGKGYDRFYLDANHDFDLTNDPVLQPMKQLPGGASRNEHAKNDVFFEYLQLKLDYGDGTGAWPVKLIPRCISYDGTHRSICFLLPTARRGRIAIGSKEFDAVLAQNEVISGRFDRPATSVLLGDTEEALGILGLMRYVDGTLYSLSATPAGDKLTVTPYTGPFGVLTAGAGERDIQDVKLEPAMGWLQSKDAIIDIGKCPQEDGKVKLPVGDYRPFRLAVRLGQLRIGVGIQLARPGEEPSPNRPPVYALKIRPDETFTFDFAHKPQVEFKTPTDKQRVKTGEELKVEAIIFEPVMGIMIAGLEDTTKKIGDSIKLPDGTEYQRYESLDPMVKITSSSGQCVAEGKMPFG